MAELVKVAISSDFLESFAALPRKIQGKVTEFINKFRNNPRSTSINYEKLKYVLDKKICSVRIDDTYRGIVVKQEAQGVYLLLWVDHHDEAYEWARRKKCEVNQKTGAIQVFDVKEVVEKKEANGIFDHVSDEDLLKLGLPVEQNILIRSFSSSKEFYRAAKNIPEDAFEGLSWVVEGFPVDEVIKLLIVEEHNEIVNGDDLAEALNTPATLKSFVTVEGEDELRRIMAEPLEKWRVFLHPTQRKIVNKEYSGATRVLGGAGTGKTVVAMHRAKRLASKLKDKEKILFTTFTANLAGDIKDNLRKICTLEEMRHIEVINLDSWVAEFLREEGYSARIIYGNESRKLWDDAIELSGAEISYSQAFYEEEWNRVVVAQEAFTPKKYLKASRKGRGTRLDRGKRVKIWKVFETYQNLMKEQQVRDVNTAMSECKTLLAMSPKINRYKHVVVDEGQDLSTNAFRLIRILVGEEKENDIFIVGDSHQRIYKNKAVLSHCGIQIRGRSSILKINYRTTEEIRKYAFEILNGISFDDLDESIDVGDKCQSLTHGLKPQIMSFKDASEELEFIVDEINKLKANGVSLKNICIVARTHNLLDDYIVQFTKKGLRSYEIKRNKLDERSLDGIRIATMHRVKGLEFQYMFIVAANENKIPLNSAIDHTDKIAEQESITAEKCLLYVAITRAQKGAYITSYGRKSPFL